MNILKTNFPPFFPDRHFGQLPWKSIIACNWIKGLFRILTLCILVLFCSVPATAQQKNLVVRIAKLQIDSAQLDAYKVALKEAIETAVRVEPGVLSLNAVYEKANPTHITVLEIYADSNAYKSHLQTPHFKKYKSSTKDMVKSLQLIETVPIALETKAKKLD
jgi:quinol monooxygenase YgiN